MPNMPIFKGDAALEKIMAFQPGKVLAQLIEDCATKYRLSKSEVIRRAIEAGISTLNK